MAFLDKYHRAHVIGAGGIGVSAVARLLKHEGKEVTGSDSAAGEITADLIAAGIPVAIGHDAKNVPDAVDLVVFSDAVPPTNPERAEAESRGVQQLSYFDFLGKFSASRKTIAVSGTNGKSTTTAMLGLMLERGGYDPTVIVGSKVPTFPQRNLRLGKSDWFVVEADEYNAHMLSLTPQLIVLTNIEADHLDFYRDLNHIRDTFKEYVSHLPTEGKLIVNADDDLAANHMEPKVAPITFGMLSKAEYAARNVRVEDGLQKFTLVHGDAVIECAMQIPGNFNVMNALAAATAALELGVNIDAVVGALRDFTGIWRRFERVGEYNGATIISDYGHHPTAVDGTLQAAKTFYGGRRVVLAFQPHHHNRTRNLFNEFVSSFDLADVLILSEVYDVAGRESEEKISSVEMVDAIYDRDRMHEITRKVMFGGSTEETFAKLIANIQPGDVVLIMGAGDIYTLAKRLVAEK